MENVRISCNHRYEFEATFHFSNSPPVENILIGELSVFGDLFILLRCAVHSSGIIDILTPCVPSLLTNTSLNEPCTGCFLSLCASSNMTLGNQGLSSKRTPFDKDSLYNDRLRQDREMIHFMRTFSSLLCLSCVFMYNPYIFTHTQCVFAYVTYVFTHFQCQKSVRMVRTILRGSY